MMDGTGSQPGATLVVVRWDDGSFLLI